jgi:hypothetical protein
MSSSTTDTHVQNTWWGRQSIETGRTDYWQIGPLDLWLEHLPHQWRLQWKHDPDWLLPNTRSLKGILPETIPFGLSPIHCAFNESSDDVILSPLLADRPVVTRLKSPLYVLPGENVTLFAVSPLWIRLEMAQPLKLLHEIPVYRLSDTWFGPVLATGTQALCYASSAPAFIDPGEVPHRLHCAITSVTVRNLGASSLLIDRIAVPAPRLSLFYSPRTGFWTNALTLERAEGSEMAALKLDRQPPAVASPAQFVSGPRQTSSDTGTMLRSFSALLRDRSNT